MPTGRNLYLEAKGEYKNLHEAFAKRAQVNFSMAAAKPTDPCIFLSHRSSDKAAVLKIGDHIMSKGIDVYIDIDDPDLQKAVVNNDHMAITAAIDLGISKSTDLLAYLTVNTATSIWVPYEIGFAKRAGNNLAAMKSKDLPALPSYLEIVKKITGIGSLNAYLIEVLGRKKTAGVVNFSNHQAIYELKTANAGESLTNYLSAQ